MRRLHRAFGIVGQNAPMPDGTTFSAWTSEAYLADGMPLVQGWLKPGAARAIRRLGLWQAARGVAGHVGEVGIHHGKLFLLLALLRRAGERAVAIDVFARQDLNPDRSGHGDRAVFEGHARRFLGGLEGVVIHETDSLLLHGADLAGDSGRFRLWSVDGCHMAGHARSDLELAFDTLAPGGVVVLDDFFHPEWPGVTEAALGLLADRRDIAPVAHGCNKLFLVHAADRDATLRFFLDEVLPGCTKAKEVSLRGWDCLWFDHP